MKICIITSNRADFGLLKNLIYEIKKKKNFKIKVIASGSHFSKKHGFTYKEIKESKIKVDRKIICISSFNNSKDISQIMSKCIMETSKIFSNIRPDLLIILGDRYEILASTISAHISRVPVAHIHGGEVTQGVIDDAFRHSITKMSHIHFVANETYRKRVIQLGENPKSVHNVGGLGVESISKTKLLGKKILEKKFNFKFNKINFLVNFHPETLSGNQARKQIKIILSALRGLKNTNLIFTLPGADLENKIILKEVKQFVKKNKNAFFYESLGQINYFSFLKEIDGMIGNSSSGLLEMPYFKKGTINIGNRQLGRLQSNSVINVKINKTQIIKAIKILLSKEFQRKIKNCKNLYGKPGASKKIVQILEKIKVKKIINKKFFDINKFNFFKY